MLAPSIQADAQLLTPWLLLLLAGTGLLAYLSTAVMVQLGRRHLLDVPVERSAHSAATPRGGGVAIVITVTCYLLLLYLFDLLSANRLLVLLCAVPVAIVGLVDDLQALPVRVRLLLHLAAAGMALYLLGPVPEPFFSGWLAMPGWSQTALLMVALVWLLNLYNFMDGIDTLAAGQSLFVCAAAGLFLWQQDDSVMWVCAGLFMATLGFMFWNLPPARIFMGDVGSTFLGFFLGLVGLVTHYSGVLSVWVWVLLMSTFIADTTATLIRRLATGHSVTEGHSTHLYQRLGRRTGNHVTVAAVYAAVNVCWSLPFAWLAITYPERGVVLAFSGIVPLMVVAAALGAGKKEEQ